jgi:ribosomal-protein-alanine N-acetyltransferase
LLKAPERIETARLVLARPSADDAERIFKTYAGDPEVTRYLSWGVHLSVGQTRAFLQFSDDEWRKWPAGPYLILSRDRGQLLGGTGLGFETPDRASTGYVLAKSAWGLGYATEALNGIVDVARTVGVRLLQAICHVDHWRSAHVLEKCGFSCEGILPRAIEFPNLARGVPCDVLKYALKL